jgi:hypothetical protein
MHLKQNLPLPAGMYALVTLETWRWATAKATIAARAQMVRLRAKLNPDRSRVHLMNSVH